MTPKRRWIRQVIETAKSENQPMPWTLARAARQTAATKPAIRTTLGQKDG